MKHAEEKTALVSSIQHGFAYIAFWQWMAFGILLLLVWVNELIDLRALMSGSAHRPPDLARGCFATAAVLFTGIITVGTTYIQQMRIVSGMVSICSYCHKIRVDTEVWQRVDAYIADHSRASLTHGICPECYAKVLSEAGAAAGDATEKGA